MPPCAEFPQRINTPVELSPDSTTTEMVNDDTEDKFEISPGCQENY